MRTLLVLISDLEFEQLELQSENFSFQEFKDIISNELSKQRLKESLIIAEKFGLSETIIDEIPKEVKPVIR